LTLLLTLPKPLLPSNFYLPCTKKATFGWLF